LESEISNWQVSERSVPELGKRYGLVLTPQYIEKILALYTVFAIVMITIQKH